MHATEIEVKVAIRSEILSIVSEGRNLVARFGKVRRERRAGKSYWRRYKSACLNILEYLLWFVIELVTRSSHPVPRSIPRPQAQIERKIW